MYEYDAENKIKIGVDKIDVVSIEQIRFCDDVSAFYNVAGEALPYAFYFKMPIKGRPLMIFGQGFQDRKLIQLPRFQRMDWASKFDCNVIIFSDPTLHLSSDMGLGWCVGNKSHYVTPRLVKIVEMARDYLGLENRNLLFYGSSAGGFTSLMLASFFHNSSALVNNPQTDILNFKMGGALSMLKIGFDGISISQARELYGERMSFIERIRTGAYIPKIYYLQNALDDHHFNDHMIPFVFEVQARLKNSERTDISSRLIFDLYYDSVALHNPVGFEKIYSCVNSIKHWFE